MFLWFFRECCRILWKYLSYQQHTLWLFLLVLSFQQQGSDGKPTKWNHSIQRRFMWKQMDGTVDGFVDRVVTGARVMKSVIGEFMPPKQSPRSAMDYLPTETTRIKYIIRNPHTKETKVIRVRPSKKVVKLMALTPKPLIADKPKSTYTHEPEYMTDKLNLKLMYMLDPEKLRHMEKEQELIAEGRLPTKNEIKPSYMAFRGEKQRDAIDVDIDFHTNGNIVSSRIQKLNKSLKPVYKLGDPPAGFTTSKPYMMSALHTSAVGELLPEPQKQVYEPVISNNFPEDDPNKSHTYEVTEYTAEESVVQPYAHQYHHKRSPSSSREISVKHSSVTTESPSNVTQIEDDTATKLSHFEYQSQHGFLPSRENYRLNEETSTTTTTITPSTTTATEEPNYPTAFLKKFRIRPDSNYNSKVKEHSKSPELPFETSWLPSNTTYSSQRVRQLPYHQHHNSSIRTLQRTKSQKWPPDVQDTYLNSDLRNSYVVSSTADASNVQEFATQSIYNNSNSRKNLRLKNQNYPLLFTEPKHQTVRKRGSVKYGDKLEIEER